MADHDFQVLWAICEEVRPAAHGNCEEAFEEVARLYYCVTGRQVTASAIRRSIQRRALRPRDEREVEVIKYLKETGAISYGPATPPAAEPVQPARDAAANPGQADEPRQRDGFIRLEASNAVAMSYFS